MISTLVRALPNGTRRQLYDQKDLRDWKRGRLASPPPVVKQRVVATYGERFGLRSLVETGTFEGAMVQAQRRRFDRIVSIELDPALHEEATRRFSSEPHIRLLQGDSSVVLEKVIAEIGEPCLFWLDAHYSEGRTARGSSDTPVAHELDLILRRGRDDVILIDDAREFGSSPSYPTLEEIRDQVRETRPTWVVEVAEDVIRIHPPSTPETAQRPAGA